MLRRRLNESHTPVTMPDNVSAHHGSSLDLEFSQLTDVGLVRDQNEDCMGYLLPATEEEARHRGWLFVVADGVGGHDRGEVASHMAVEHLVNGFKTATPGEPGAATLQRLVQRANLAIYEAAMGTGPAGKSMATTVVSCLVRYDRVVVAHVGDSRCYLIRNGRVHAITDDHTMSQEQLRMGLISVRDAKASQHSNILSRSVGHDMVVNVDVTEEQIYPDDTLLLCSDGLHNSVKEPDLARVVAHPGSLDEKASELISLARQRDGKDNITVQLVRVKAVERVGMYRGRHYKLR